MSLSLSLSEFAVNGVKEKAKHAVIMMIVTLSAGIFAQAVLREETAGSSTGCDGSFQTQNCDVVGVSPR